jgi:hypothetical protein
MAQTTATKEKTTNRTVDRIAGTSPLVYARVAGFLLLFIVLIAPFSQLYSPSTLVVPGDATATADNIGASGWVFQLGIVSDSLVFLIEIVLCVLLYVLLRPVSRTLSGCGVCQAGDDRCSGNQSACLFCCTAVFEWCWLLDRIWTSSVGGSRIAIDR